MKKRGVLIVTGAAVFCLLLGIYIMMKKQNDTEETSVTEEEEQQEVLSVSEDEIKNLSFRMEGDEVTWSKEEENWTLSQDENFPVDANKMKSLTSALSSLTAERTLEEVSNLKDYGLETPENVIEIEKTDGSTESISVGSKNPSTGHTYVSVGENKDTVYTVSSDLASVFSGSIYDFALSEEYPSITGTTIQKISVDKKENSYVVESNADSSTGWTVKDGKKNEKEADSGNAGTLQSTVAGLTYSGYYAYDCEDWSAYGLDKPKMTLTVDYTEQVTVTDESDTENSDEESDDESIDNEEENAANENSDEDSNSPTTETVEKSMILYIGSLSEDGNYYVRLGDSSEVHGMSQSSIDTLMNGKAFDYWKLSIDYIAIAELDHLDVTYEDQTYTLKRVVTEESEKSDDENAIDAESESADESEDNSEDTKVVTTYYLDEKEADSETFLEFFREALGMTCQSRLEEYTEKNEPELILTYYGTDGEEVKITYTSRDSNFYTVADQNGNYGLVNKMNVKELVDKWIKLYNSVQQ